MSYILTMNERDGVLEVFVIRVSTLPEIDAYERHLLAAAAAARCSAGRLRVLVDVSGLGPVPVHLVGRLMALEARLIQRDDDRVAVLLDSSLAKARLARPSSHRQINHFISAQAARTWLLAYDRLQPSDAVTTMPAAAVHRQSR